MNQSKQLLAASDRIYHLLLRAYPSDFRQRYGPEMAQVFRDSCRDALVRQGALGIVGLYLHTIGDLLVSALQERAAATHQPPKAPQYVEERSPTMSFPGRPPRLKMSLDTFTKRAKQVLQLATEEARALNHAYIGTEHLLLGLIRERNGVSGEVLQRLGITLDQARGTTQLVIGVGQSPAPDVQPLSKRTVQALERAVAQAQQLNHSFVGTEHLLLGVIETSDGAAVGILERLGLPAADVRSEVVRVLGQT